MAEVIYIYPLTQVVPEMTSQDDEPGTLILRPGQVYDFIGDPPGDPAWWQAAKPPAMPKPVPDGPAPTPVPVPSQEG